MRSIHFFYFVVIFNLIPFAMANNHQGHKEGHPPKEAVQACVDKSPESSCQFTGKEGQTLDGKCFKPQGAPVVFCRPGMPDGGDGAHKGDHGRPPKESLDACKDKGPGTTCQFIGKDGQSIQGECFKPQQAPHPFCRPEKK